MSCSNFLNFAISHRIVSILVLRKYVTLWHRQLPVYHLPICIGCYNFMFTGPKMTYCTRDICMCKCLLHQHDRITTRDCLDQLDWCNGLINFPSDPLIENGLSYKPLSIYRLYIATCSTLYLKKGVLHVLALCMKILHAYDTNCQIHKQSGARSPQYKQD